MTDVVARDTAPWRFAMRVLTAFGLLAALLAAVGLVGLLWMAVTFRARELGIRAALGATPARLRAHVLSEALWIGGIAVAVGTLAAMALGRSLAGLLVETSPHDAVSAIGAVVTTLALAAAGCAWPVRRAAAADPIEALREHG
jgi:ABC-type antimicrobial peptide transport system permease subunit